jgi:hypothetical protein
MYYVIDAVRWGGNGRISHVKWHPVEMRDDDVRRGGSTVVPVVDAAQACDEHEVRVYVDDGQVGRFFRMRACEEGLEAEPDGAPATLRDRIAHLPAF